MVCLLLAASIQANVAVSQRLATVAVDQIRFVQIVFGRSVVVETTVGYSDRLTIGMWKAALARSYRLTGGDPGLEKRRPFSEGLVRFTLVNGRTIALPFHAEGDIRVHWGAEVQGLYDAASWKLGKVMAETPPRADGP